MNIDKKYLKKYYHVAAVEQLCELYKKKGYKVSVEEKIGNFRLDMVARKEDSIIFFEVKTGDVRAETKARIRELRNYLEKNYPNCKFLLVAVRYPDEDNIVIDNIESILLNFFVGYGIPSELDELSTYTTIEDFSNVSINSVEISSGSIKIECEGYVKVNLDYDNHESGADFNMSFPFILKGELEYINEKLEMVDFDEFNADTSEFYA